MDVPTDSAASVADRHSRRLRLLVGALAAAALAGGIVHLVRGLFAIQDDPSSWQGVTALVNGGARLLAVPAFGLLAVVIAWRAPWSPGALFGALFLSAYSLWGLAVGNMAPGSPLPLLVYVTLADWIAHAAAVRFTQLFPRRLRPEEITFGSGLVGRTVARLYAALLDPRVFWTVALAVEITVRSASNPGLYFAHVLGVSALAVGYLYQGYRTGSEDERQRVFWLMEAAVVFLTVELAFVSIRTVNALGIFALDLAVWGPWLSTAQTWIALLCFALAIFYRGAFDSRLVLRRTTVASASGVLAVVIFITLETAVTETIEGLFGFESQAGAIVAGVAVALLLRPLMLRLDRRVSRPREDAAS